MHGRSAQGMHTFDDEVLIARRSAPVLGAALGPLVFGATLAVAGHPATLALGLALAWLGLGSVLYVWTRSPCAAERPARARADGRGLLIDGRLVLESDRIAGGWLETRLAAPPVVHLRARRFGCPRAVDVVVRDVERGRALLTALEVDPTQASAHYWVLARPLGDARAFARAGTLLALVLAFGVVAGQSAPAALALGVVALVALVLGVVVPTRVTVGADGVLVRWLGTTRFVPWATVVAIEDFDGGVVLALDGGAWMTLRTPGDHERHHPERGAMIERMRVAWRAHGRAAANDPTARLVARAGGHTREWVRAVRRIVRPEHGYRAPALPPEHLWRVVEDACVDRHARTGAALALAPLLDERGRDRMRSAASACAEPRLRAALHTAATEAGAAAPDDELAAVLDALECEGDDDADRAG
jgi:hypothetical protein